MTQILDLTAISFPSDDLTFRAVRRAWPEHIDKLRSKGQASLDDVLIGIIDSERILAEAAFEQALGRAPRAISEFNDGLRKGLIDDYIRYGLSTGPQHAEQMIRNFESQATSQAKGLNGPG